jgi:hypothetical protein
MTRRPTIVLAGSGWLLWLSGLGLLLTSACHRPLAPPLTGDPEAVQQIREAIDQNE